MPRDAAALVWMANLACLELHPHPVRADDLDHPDELRVDLDPVPGVEWPQIREVARRRARDARRSRPRRLAEDVGLARHARLRAHRAALDVRRGAARRAGAGARGRAARARRSRRASGGRKSATACSSTTTRTPRIARSPAPTRCGRRPTRASRRRSTWDEIDDCDPGDFTLAHDAGAVRARSAIGTPASTSTPARSSALLELSARQEREGLGDAPWPPHYRKQAGRGAARRAVDARADAEASADRDRPRAQEGRRARRARALEGAASRGEPRTSSRPTCSWTRMRGRFRTWTRIRVNLQHVPDGAAAGAGAARSRREPGGRLERRHATPARPRRRPSRARTAS